MIPTSPDIIHVDCSASAITNLEMRPIFEGNLITPQTVRSYQPVFSAAFVAHVEAAYETEEQKNTICKVVPLPNHDTDWLRALAVFMTNQYTWGQDKALRQWLRSNRLDGFSQLTAGARNDPDKKIIMDRIKASVMPAMMKLQQYISQLDQQTA